MIQHNNFNTSDSASMHQKLDLNQQTQIHTTCPIQLSMWNQIWEIYDLGKLVIEWTKW